MIGRLGIFCGPVVTWLPLNSINTSAPLRTQYPLKRLCILFWTCCAHGGALQTYGCCWTIGLDIIQDRPKQLTVWQWRRLLLWVMCTWFTEPLSYTSRDSGGQGLWIS